MCGTLILSYISRFCPFLEIQNLNYIFFWGGAGDQKNKYVWRYDEIIIYFFYVLEGQCSDMEKVFGVAKVRICFGYLYFGGEE